MRLYFIQNTASSLSQSFKFLSHDPRGTFYDDSNNNTDNGSEWMIYHDANHIIIQSVYSLCNITRPSKFWEREQECITLKIPSNRCLSEFCAQHGQILCLDRRAMKGALGVMWKRRWSKWHYITLVLQTLRKHRRLPWTATVRTQHGKQGKWTSDLLLLSREFSRPTALDGKSLHQDMFQMFFTDYLWHHFNIMTAHKARHRKQHALQPELLEPHSDHATVHLLSCLLLNSSIWRVAVVVS